MYSSIHVGCNYEAIGLITNKLSHQLVATICTTLFAMRAHNYCAPRFGHGLICAHLLVTWSVVSLLSFMVGKISMPLAKIQNWQFWKFSFIKYELKSFCHNPMTNFSFFPSCRMVLYTLPECFGFTGKLLPLTKIITIILMILSGGDY